MVGWKALQKQLDAFEPDEKPDGCIHSPKYWCELETGKTTCTVCEIKRLRTQCRDLIDTVLACLQAAGGSEDLDELERQCNAAGPRPSFFIAQQIGELHDFIAGCVDGLAGKTYDPDLMPRLAKKARAIAARKPPRPTP